MIICLIRMEKLDLSIPQFAGEFVRRIGTLHDVIERIGGTVHVTSVEDQLIVAEVPMAEIDDLRSLPHVKQISYRHQRRND